MSKLVAPPAPKKYIEKDRTRKVRNDRKEPTYDDIIEIKNHIMYGLNITNTAAQIGVSKKTLERWAKRYPQIADAIRKGRALKAKRACLCYFEQAFPLDENNKPTKKGDPSLMIFFMKTQLKWKEPDKNISITNGDAEKPIINIVSEAPRLLDDEK